VTPRKRKNRARRRRPGKQSYDQHVDLQEDGERATGRADVYLPDGPLVDLKLPRESFQFGLGYQTSGETGGRFTAGAGYEGGPDGPSPVLIAIAGCVISLVLVAAGIICAQSVVPGWVVAATFGMAVAVFTGSVVLSAREQALRRAERQRHEGEREARAIRAAASDVAPTAIEINGPKPQRPKTLESDGEPAS
jgi:hypothetical protein